MKKIRNKINGVLLLDKPLEISSNNAIQKVKYVLNAEKVGHTGTLDPMATGLLPICLGEATKFANFLLDGDKEYTATAQLGVVTDSGDSEGNIIAQNPVSTDIEQIKLALRKYTGKITQIPPMYSALKHNGRPLYEYARAGITIDRPSREITVHSLKLVDYNRQLAQLTFSSTVSKGTYIRTLAEDIGNELGCGASLVALRRNKTNQFALNNAYTLEQIIAAESYLELNILPVDVLCAELAEFTIDDDMYKLVRNGNQCKLVKEPDHHYLNATLRLYYQQRFIGVGEIVLQDNQLILAPKRMLANL